MSTSMRSVRELAIYCQNIQTTGLALSSYTVAMHTMYVHT